MISSTWLTRHLSLFLANKFLRMKQLRASASFWSCNRRGSCWCNGSGHAPPPDIWLAGLVLICQLIFQSWPWPNSIVTAMGLGSDCPFCLPTAEGSGADAGWQNSTLSVLVSQTVSYTLTDPGCSLTARPPVAFMCLHTRAWNKHIYV